MTLSFSTLPNVYAPETFAGREFQPFPAHVGQSFANWFADMTLLNAEELGFNGLFCSITGEAYGTRELAETRLMALSLAQTVTEFDGLVEFRLPQVYNKAIELWDVMADRFVMAMRPSHAFSLGNSRDILALMSRERQTVALLMKMVCDVHNNGMASQYRNGGEGVYARNTLVLEVAARVNALATDQEFVALYTSLVELDAKYSINAQLAMVNKERAWFLEAFEKFLGGLAWDLFGLIRAMVVKRDAMTSLDPTPRWSQQVFATRDFHVFASKLQEYRAESVVSNLYDPNAGKPSNRHVADYKRKMNAKSDERQAAKSGKPKASATAKPKTEKQELKAKLKAGFSFTFNKAPTL